MRRPLNCDLVAASTPYTRKIALKYDFSCTSRKKSSIFVYQIKRDSIQSISAKYVSFDYSSQQLTETDSILCADLSAHLLASVTIKDIESALPILQTEYLRSVNTARKQINSISQEMPKEWALPPNKILAKLTELVEPQWVEDTWNNFIECLKSNSNYGK